MQLSRSVRQYLVTLKSFQGDFFERTGQKKVVLQTPLLLNALLNVSIARNWLFPSLFVMRLQAHLVQALPPTAADNHLFTQLPGIGYDEIPKIAPKAKDMSEFLRSLEEKEDPRASDVKKAMERWGHVVIVDAAFKGLHGIHFIFFH
jgi:translocation protein SEC63